MLTKIKHTLLIEIGTEELPPKILRTLAETFASNIENELNTANIFHKEIDWFATPCRLAVTVKELASTQSDRIYKRRGPAITKSFDTNGNPTKEATSWARACGINLNQAERLINKNGEWLIHYFYVRGKSVKTLLCNIINQALNNLKFFKMMRWGDNEFQFIRPVNNVTILLDNSIITGKVFGINVNRFLRGHRFIGEKKIRLEHADQYLDILLSRGRVIADYSKRKEKIRREIKIAAEVLGGTADINDILLEEITSLVEWPVVLTAHFEEKFLSIPPEAIVYIMKENQKYFPVYNTAGNLMPYFIFVANIESKEPHKIITGNEKVLRSRLKDAEFFFNKDRKQRLENYLSGLNKVLFQKELGTLGDKSVRIKILSSWIANRIGANVSNTARAGLLSKCDLITNMVFEFSGIQGIMGMHYARYDGEPEEVSLAQKEQYHPRFSGDTLPTTLVSCAVAIADKMDTLTGIFGIGQSPKGDKDPFALRRAAVGVLRIIIEKRLPLDLKKLIQEASRLYLNKLTNIEVVKDVLDFMLIRLLNLYQEYGYSFDTIQAVLARRPTQLYDFDDRIRALNYFRTLNDAAILIVINKRVSRILSKSNVPAHKKIQVPLLKEPAEINLATHVRILEEKLKPIFEAGRYQDVLIELTRLNNPVNAFFDSVIVLTEDDQLRINRLLLLSELQKLLSYVADISLLKNN